MCMSLRVLQEHKSKALLLYLTSRNDLVQHKSRVNITIRKYENIHLCICQALAGPLGRQLYQAPVSKNFLNSEIVSGFGNCIWDGSPGGTVTGWPFLKSLFHTFPLDGFSSFVKDQKTIGVWVHFWVFNFISLIYLPVTVQIQCSFYHYSSVVQLEVKHGYFIKCSFIFEKSFHYPGFFVIPDDFANCTF